MTTFVALYRGATVSEARILAVSTNTDLVSHVASCLLADPNISADVSDPVLHPVQQGRRQALRLVARLNEANQNEDAEPGGGFSQ